MSIRPITLDEIRAAADRLATAHAATTASAALLQQDLEGVIQPIYDQHRPVIDAAAAAEASAKAVLDALLMRAPGLFQQPRSITVNGVRAGYKKEADSLDWPDDAELIARIRALAPELAAVLIRTQESIVVDALEGLPDEQLQALGIRRINGADRRFITIGNTDVEKLAALAVASAAQRQGEDEAPKTKKGKARAGKTREVA